MEREMKIDAQESACEGTCGQQSTKASYEQLANIANQLYVQNQEMGKKLNEIDMENFFKRLDWLWQIINSTTPYITEQFKQECGKEFMDMMVKPEEETPVEGPKE
jgi:hypothetical protein